MPPSVKALVGVDVKAKDVLPQDIQVEGFDNIAAALRRITRVPGPVHHRRPADREDRGRQSQSRVANVKHSVAASQEGDCRCLRARVGACGSSTISPQTGSIASTFSTLGWGLYTGTLENETTLVIMVDGKIVFRKPIGGPEDQDLVDKKGPAGRDEIMARFTKIPVHVEAGVRDVVVAFIDRSHVESDENFAAGFSGIGALGFGSGTDRIPRLADGVEIVGPYNPTGVSRTPSRALIFVCDPKTQSKAAGEPACARKITENLARRAFRRPVTSEDVNRLMPFYEIGRENGGSFDLGIEQVVTAVLGSPEFLYRSIRGATARGSGSTDTEVTLTDLELASRLSFFLWNTGPDDQLLTLAAAGGLTKPGAPQLWTSR